MSIRQIAQDPVQLVLDPTGGVGLSAGAVGFDYTGTFFGHMNGRLP